MSYKVISDQWAALGWDITAGADDATLSICDGSVGGGSTADNSSGGVADG